jgi:hypothetical protein
VYQGALVATLGLKDLQFPDMGARGGLPDEARIVYHRMDKLPIQYKAFVLETPLFPFRRVANTLILCASLFII